MRQLAATIVVAAPCCSGSWEPGDTTWPRETGRGVRSTTWPKKRRSLRVPRDKVAGRACGSPASWRCTLETDGSSLLILPPTPAIPHFSTHPLCHPFFYQPADVLLFCLAIFVVWLFGFDSSSSSSSSSSRSRGLIIPAAGPFPRVNCPAN